jgi:hypothetical protein
MLLGVSQRPLTMTPEARGPQPGTLRRIGEWIVLLPLWRKAMPGSRSGQVGMAIATPFLYLIPFLYFISLAIVAGAAGGGSNSSTAASNALTATPAIAQNAAPTPTGLFDSFQGAVQPTDVLHLDGVDIQAGPLANAVGLVVDGSPAARQTCIIMQSGNDTAIKGYMQGFATALAEATPVAGQAPSPDDLGLARAFFGQACRARFVVTGG